MKNNENKSFFQTPLGIFSIILFVTAIIYIIYINKTYSDDYLKEVKQNWNNYRCKPSVIPIAGLVGPKGTSTTNNLYDCFNEKVHGIFNTLMAPFISIINVIMNVLDQLIENVNGILKVIDYIRDSITSIVKAIYGEIKDIMLKLEKIFNDFINVFKDVYETIAGLISIAIDAFYSIASLGNWFSHSIFCFDEYTKIKINNNTYKNIKDVKVGDILNDNCIVESVLKLSANKAQMYDYFGVIVSGSHLVYESGINKWIRVKDSEYSKKIERYNKPYIYSLITSDAKIPININTDSENIDVIFADWYEISDNKTKNKIQDLTLSILNNTINSDPIKLCGDNKYNISNNWWGFSNDSEIDMYKKGDIKKICDIKIGDKLRNGNKVLAVVEHSIPKNIKLYKLKSYKVKSYKHIITTGNQIIYNKDMKKWIKVSSSNDYDEYCIDKHNLGTNKDINKLYHIITENNQISINGEIFTDFYQLSPNKSKLIDRFVENKINI